MKIITGLLGRKSPKKLSSLTFEELKAFKPTEFTLPKEVKPEFVLAKKPEKPERKEPPSPPKQKEAPKPSTPELKKPDTNEVRLTKFGGEDFLKYIKSLDEKAESELEKAERELKEAKSKSDIEKKEKEKKEKEEIKLEIKRLKENIFEIQKTEITFFKQVLLVLEVLKVIEVYPGLNPDLRKRLSDYKKNVVRLINSIGLHKDLNKTFFTTLDTILVSTEELEAKKKELIEIFSNLIDKFQNEEMKKIDNIMKIYGYHSDIGLTLSDIVINGYNPYLSGHVNANSCFTIFNARMLRYRLLYESLKKIMKKKIPELSEYYVSANVEKMYNFIESLAYVVDKNAPQNEAEEARKAKEAAAAQVARLAKEAAAAEAEAAGAAKTPEATSQQSIPLPPIPPADPAAAAETPAANSRQNSPLPQTSGIYSELARSRQPQNQGHRTQQTYNSLADRRKQGNYRVYNTPSNNEVAAATKIQAAFRIYKAKKEAGSPAEGEESALYNTPANEEHSVLSHKAATKIQAAFRGHRARKAAAAVLAAAETPAAAVLASVAAANPAPAADPAAAQVAPAQVAPAPAAAPAPANKEPNLYEGFSGLSNNGTSTNNRGTVEQGAYENVVPPAAPGAPAAQAGAPAPEAAPVYKAIVPKAKQQLYAVVNPTDQAQEFERTQGVNGTVVKVETPAEEVSRNENGNANGNENGNWWKDTTGFSNKTQ